ncbi:hypothetical protein U9M48_030948 [Paspalum notatum var. saurae]|uniref:Uncharacterized protein n=1 Tax=Paspalum notatum var. saurae TaxID=547442 RepID=A0AAQ3U6C9_PASNO
MRWSDACRRRIIYRARFFAHPAHSLPMLAVREEGEDRGESTDCFLKLDVDLLNLDSTRQRYLQFFGAILLTAAN